MPYHKIQVNSLIQKFNKRLDTIITEDLKIIKSIKKNVIQSGGKRIRPLTHYFLSVLLGYKGEKNYTVGAVAELIHAASLLHDDVIDKAEMRRGMPTVGNLYGNKTAILSGDFLLACGIDSLNKLQNPSLLDSYTKVIRDLAVGELIQMQWEKDPKITKEIYHKIIYGKTASLFGAVCETAGILANSNSKMMTDLRNFGVTMGMMFQKRDDYLDYFDTTKKIGKIPYKDFHNGLYTYPIIHLRKFSDTKEKNIINEIFQKIERNDSDAKWIESLLEKYKVKEFLEKETNLEKEKLINFLLQFSKNSIRDLLVSRIEDLS